LEGRRFDVQKKLRFLKGKRRKGKGMKGNRRKVKG
jgi:hypothetical protein